MIVLRLVPALLLFVLLAGPAMVLPDQADAAYCMCDQSCPQPYCKCYPYCRALIGTSQNVTANNTFQVRAVRSFAVLDSTINGTTRSSLTLSAIPQGYLKLQCQRLKEILDWASELLDGTSELQQSYSVAKVRF
jgi:hypothetical protein